MKKIGKIAIIMIVFGVLFVSCSSKTGKVGKINPNDISYFKDPRTGLCFAIIGAKDGSNVLDESTSIGMACVPCEAIEGKVKLEEVK